MNEMKQIELLKEELQVAVRYALTPDALPKCAMHTTGSMPKML